MSVTKVNEGVGFFKQLEDRIADLERQLGQPSHSRFPGEMVPWAGPISADANTNANATNPNPNGFLLCNGAAVSRTTYFDLFNIIGTEFGAGNGTTTFNLPDMRGRVPVGEDSTGIRITSSTSIRNRGQVGGVERHTLSVPELPSHTHSLDQVTGGSDNIGNLSRAADGSVADGNYSTNSVGSNNPHQNMPPYQIVNYIIKT